MFQLNQGVGQRPYYQVHTLGAVCGRLLHWQCRTTLGMLSTLTEAVRVKIRTGFGTSASIYICVCVYIYVCVYIHVCVYIYIYIYIMCRLL